MMEPISRICRSLTGLILADAWDTAASGLMPAASRRFFLPSSTCSTTGEHGDRPATTRLDDIERVDNAVTRPLDVVPARLADSPGRMVVCRMTERASRKSTALLTLPSVQFSSNPELVVGDDSLSRAFGKKVYVFPRIVCQGVLVVPLGVRDPVQECLRRSNLAVLPLPASCPQTSCHSVASRVRDEARLGTQGPAPHSASGAKHNQTSSPKA
ncbi:MAG: hypothetical protein U0793_03355 [Gemmataceae bacterium]